MNKVEKTYKLAQLFTPPLSNNHHVNKLVSLGYWGTELRLDIRKWQNGELGKGISLTEDEARNLRIVLEKTDFGAPSVEADPGSELQKLKLENIQLQKRLSALESKQQSSTTLAFPFIIGLLIGAALFGFLI